ncbi:hypothetical protein GF367_03005 [Candidatus Woesearchaeota archaeon]|nr:hypothetical protein [Candidatus Woesearchaeota archaeon]
MKFLFGCCLVLFSVGVVAGAQLPLRGTVLNSTGGGVDGDLRVYIYDAAVGGTLVYDSGGDFNGSIVDGSYAVVLGNTSTALNLVYGKTYYLDLAVNAENFDFNGAGRQAFESHVGPVTNISAVNISDATVLTNLSTPTLCLNGVCRTTWPSSGSGNETFNLTDDVYIYSSGTTLYLNETQLNATIDARATGVTDGTGGWTNTSSWTNTSLHVNVSGNVTTAALCLSGVCYASWPAADSGKAGDGVYLYNTSNTMYFNETKLNATIDARATGFTGGWSNNSVNTTTSLNVVSSGNVTAVGGWFSWLGSVGNFITSLFVQDVNVTGNLTLNGTPIDDWGDISGGADGTGGWANDSVSTNTSLDVFVNGSLNVTGNVTVDDLTVLTNASVPVLCLNGDCQSSWPVDTDTTGSWTNDSVTTNTSLGVVIDGTLDVAGNTTLTNLTTTGNVTIGDVLYLNVRDSLPTAVTGAVILYNNSGPVFPCFYNSTAWVRFENSSMTCP